MRGAKSTIKINVPTKVPYHVQLQKDEFKRQNELVKNKKKELRNTLDEIKCSKIEMREQTKKDEELAKFNEKMESGVEGLLKSQRFGGSFEPNKTKTVDMDHELAKILKEAKEPQPIEM